MSSGEGRDRLRLIVGSACLRSGVYLRQDSPVFPGPSSLSSLCRPMRRRAASVTAKQAMEGTGVCPSQHSLGLTGGQVSLAQSAVCRRRRTAWLKRKVKLGRRLPLRGCLSSSRGVDPSWHCQHHRNTKSKHFLHRQFRRASLPATHTGPRPGWASLSRLGPGLAVSLTADAGAVGSSIDTPLRDDSVSGGVVVGCLRFALRIATKRRQGLRWQFAPRTAAYPVPRGVPAEDAMAAS